MKTTPWYPSGTKPLLAGWYDRKYSDGIYRHWWDGSVWRSTPTAAPHWRQVDDYPEWRGLTESQFTLKALRRRVDKARKFPTNTCPASRHLHMIAEGLLRKGGYPMLQDEPEHCAETMLAVLESLWEGRTRYPAP